MTLKVLRLAVFAIALTSQQARAAQPAAISPKIVAQHGTIEHPTISGDLVQALIFAGQHFKRPIVAELAQPYPTKVFVAAGKHDAASYFNLVIRDLKNYRVEEREGVYWIYDSRLIRARGNFLNGLIPDFRTPLTLGEFEDFFPMYISVAQGRGGGVIGGLHPAADDSVQLRPDRIKNVPLREALFSVARQVPTLFALFVFPNSKVPNWRDAEGVYSTLGTIDSVTANPPHLRSLPATKPRRVKFGQ